jgi:hypothetical protein
MGMPQSDFGQRNFWHFEMRVWKAIINVARAHKLDWRLVETASLTMYSTKSANKRTGSGR